ncbi:MAG: S-layer homology domain-containing protein [Clostridia bacterium]|nr:S-layer homology domain-containing protein [Clostridia bacterium]
MLKKICLCIATVMLYGLLTCGAAFAAPACNVSVDTDTETITISGTIDVSGETQLSLIILNAGMLGENPYELSDFLLASLAQQKLNTVYDENFKDVINSFRQITTNADGSFETSFKMSAPVSGDFGAVLNYRKNEADEFALVTPFFYCTPEHVALAVDAVNGTDASAMANKIVSLSRELNIDVTDYKKLDSKAQATVSAYVHNIAKELKAENGKGFSGAGDIKGAFSEAMGYYELKNADSKKLSSLLEKHSSLLALSEMSEYGTYTDILSAKEQKDVLEACAGFADCDDIDEIKRLFGDNVILCAVKTAESWTEINPILTANKAAFTELDSEYWNLEDTSDIDKEIVGVTFESLSDMTDEMNALIENEDDDKGGYGGGYGGGSSGGGGGSSSNRGGGAALTAPPITNDTADAELPFGDMAGYDWAKEAVSELYKAGIVNGKDDKSFAPGDFVTREEFVKMLVCLLGEYDENAKADFNDADENAWYYSYIGSAQLCGISNGLGDGRFGVGMLITRQDIAVMASRAAGITAANNAPEFADGAEVSEYAKESVSALASNGIISGMGDGAFAPKQNATRAQAAKILFELYKWKEKTV